MLARLFQQSPLRKTRSTGEWLVVLNADSLLAPLRTLSEAIRSLVGVPDTHWDTLYRPLVESFAAWVQQLPASEAHHHAGPGGLLRHGLEVAHEVLRLRRSSLLPSGAPAEELARLQDVWTYACVTAALMHDIGKPMSDLRVALFDAAGRAQGLWAPLAGPMPPGFSYRVEFNRGRVYRRHGRIAPLLARHVVPVEGLNWLTSEPEVMDAWLAAIQGEYEEAGPLGVLVLKADGLSVARDLSGGMGTRMPTARARPLAERLLTALRHLLAEEALSLNRPGAAGFLADDTLWLVSKRVLDALREQMLREGQPGVPSRNDRLMDELQQHGLLVPNGDRAVWTCEVRVGDWSQRLTCLRFEADRLWPDADRRPAPLDGMVIPLDEGGVASSEQAGSGANESDGAGEPDPGAQSPDVASGSPGAGLTEPVGDASVDPVFSGLDPDPIEDLPLPFDQPPEGVDSPLREETRSPAAASAEAPRGGQTTSQPARQAAPPSPTFDTNDVGQRFLAWLREAIASGRVEINTPKARLHVLPEGLALVSPGIFRDFDPVHWDRAQKRLQKLKHHRKLPDGTNIWTCRVEKERKRSLIRAILIPDPERVLGVRLPPPNPVVSLVMPEDGQGG
ncbi:MobH family relaxase [Thioalbus denitrificans]|uniref:Integrating conjugative element relaxase (TIGR03760 family) n=1 Tax=Thioalbus denitrificans TaxID=547122 RepID=A0A369CG69_9GAMM|nr:MobH family relaxase [Thioalbus denitrificans]RCX31686.1 integrating conjugative element relaxase (TIGR03760 family) [Thioalbus denitrificans]